MSEEMEDDRTLQMRREHKLQHEKALNRAVPRISLHSLLPHERDLYLSGALKNITHQNSNATWLECLSSLPSSLNEQYALVYRAMGDTELQYLLDHGKLPDTQPYQTIAEGPIGRWYVEKYLVGQKRTDTQPTTIVEFVMSKEIVDALKERQMKVEDGTLSMGLGFKAGRGLDLFNRSLLEDENCTFKIVKVKRMVRKKS